MKAYLGLPMVFSICTEMKEEAKPWNEERNSFFHLWLLRLQASRQPSTQVFFFFFFFPLLSRPFAAPFSILTLPG